MGLGEASAESEPGPVFESGGQMIDAIRRAGAAADVELYELAGRFDLSWRGLARYLRKRVAL